MTNEGQNKIDEFGKIFRFITPLLMLFFGFVSVTYLKQIDEKFLKIDSKMDSFSDSTHLMDKRIDRLEYKIFGSDGWGNKGLVGQ